MRTRVALLALAEQGRHRHAEELAEQVEQRRLERGDRMDGDAQVEGLLPAPAAVAITRSFCRMALSTAW